MSSDILQSERLKGESEHMKDGTIDISCLITKLKANTIERLVCLCFFAGSVILVCVVILYTMMSNYQYILSGAKLSTEFYSECNQTLDDYLLNKIQNSKDRVFMVDGTTGEQLLLSEFIEKSYNLAAHLQSLGCRPGMYVGIISENRLEYPIVTFAITLTGAIVTAFNPQYTPGELNHTLSISKPSILFCSSQTFSVVKEVSNTRLIQLDTETTKMGFSDTLFYSDLIKNSSKKLVKVDLNVNDTLVLLYSSGTTGFPKGVMLSHKSVVFMLHLIKEKNIWNFVGNFTLGVFPMSHILGFFITFNAITLDHTLISMNKFEEKLYLSLIQKYRVEYLYLVPTLVIHLLKSSLTSDYNLTSIKYGICGGASLKRAQQIEFSKKLQINLFQAYGMTESGLTLTVTKSHNTKAGTCGSLAPEMQAKVVHIETNEALGPGEIGELCFRTPAMMRGYLNNPSDTAYTIREGWLHSGDLGYYDADGDFYVVDRLKELIKYKAYQVAPSELEAILLNHEDVKEAVVIGIPDEEAGELPKAFVVKQFRANITEGDLIKFVADKVSPQKQLRGGVSFIDEVPKSQSGKVLRRLLKQTIFLNGSRVPVTLSSISKNFK